MKSDRPKELKDTASAHMPWKNPAGKYIFQTTPLEINAPIETVWKYVLDIPDYYTLSNHAIYATVDGKPEVGKTISMQLYRDKTLGKIFFGTSNETITELNDKNKTIGWERDLKCSGTTERYQVLIPSEDGKKTTSYIALKIPGIVGCVSSIGVFKNSIQSAFKQINEGIKIAAEKEESQRQLKNP